jgi:hypothetical protein
MGRTVCKGQSRSCLSAKFSVPEKPGTSPAILISKTTELDFSHKIAFVHP